MSQESELQRLERFVAKLLTNFSELRAEKARLVQQLGERDQELAELQAKLATEQAERGEIGQRVGKLVDQIEEWEMSLDAAAEVAVAPAPPEEVSAEEDSEPDEYEVQEAIEEITAESRGEEEVRVQHNLFSLTSAQR